MKGDGAGATGIGTGDVDPTLHAMRLDEPGSQRVHQPARHRRAGFACSHHRDALHVPEGSLARPQLQGIPADADALLHEPVGANRLEPGLPDGAGVPHQDARFR
jgi:hypothetical protein